ncbi:hypothetical protein I302_104805 [Kwoniella bestiolae CBS 10118]|uniref:Glycerophosphocholine acyltransferase 1 n=1 Tax=Kwoniella bestiolae CBS 10118 TaxID=1296100 RepID=A0A1B9FRP9_9TREE|nr:integral membrane protein [Kwoniella bestiolae CBS 10118]OCF21447.1 integral membrane protein [Kwoniella bestiolae CBS 10118]
MSTTDPPRRGPLPRSASLTNIMTLPSLDRYSEDWAGALTLLDVIETFFDSRLDLFNRRIKAQSSKLKSRAVELLPKGLRTPGGGGSTILYVDEEEPSKDGEKERGREGDSVGEKYRREVEREVERIKVKLAAKVTHLSSSWRSAQVVRTKDKISFLFGVMSLAFTCLLYGMRPDYMPLAYTIQSALYLPLRFYTYKRKAWHYFLFGDLCYFVNVLDLLWIWVFPSSTVLFICCYLLTLGPIASAIITWRNSLVFHSLDKIISIFIHIYPPMVLSVIRHNYPNAEERYPGLKDVGNYKWYTMILLSGVPYIIWQGAYYKFISLDRKSKIESGQRQNSFQYLLNDKRGPIGKALRGIRPEHRELWFIFCQLIYSIIFMVPPAALFIHSSTASSAFLIIIFAVSAWNGASFYVEVFGRKFERELEILRKEMELASATGTSSSSIASTSTPQSPSTFTEGEPANDSSSEQSVYESDEGDEPHQKTKARPAKGLDDSPLILPSAQQGQQAGDMEVPEYTLDRAVEEVDKEGKKDV